MGSVNRGRLIEQGIIAVYKILTFRATKGMYTIKLSNQGEMKVRKVIIQ